MKHLFLFMFLSWNYLLSGQGHHAIYLDLGALAQKGGGGAYTFKINQRSRVELSVGFQKYADTPDWLFNGNVITHLLQQRVDTFNSSNQVLGSSDWQSLVEDSRPDAPRYLPLSSWQFNIGWQFSFQKRKSPWRMFLQPGIWAASLRIYETQYYKQLEADYYNNWHYGLFPNLRTVQSHSLAYIQTRAMRLKQAWSYGVSYSIGVARQWRKHFSLQGRLNSGLNFAIPYKDSRPPNRLRGMWVQPAILAGWAF